MDMVYDGFGNNGLWLFAILALMNGGFGGGWGRGMAGVATTEDVAAANNFNEIKNALGGINTNILKGFSDIGYANLQNFSGVKEKIGDTNLGLTKGLCDLGYTEGQRFAGVERQIDGVKYDVAAKTGEWGQKILDRLAQDKAERQAARISQLERQLEMAGVVKYPMQTTYATNCNPFFGGCGCANI